MTPEGLHIDPDIRRARTLPAAVYSDPAWFDRVRDRVLARAWHLVADADRVRVPGACHPTLLLEGVLDERETGVHHFHRLLAELLNDTP